MKKTLFTLIALAAPRMALACPVCFGQSDSPIASATNMGIMFMLAVVAGMLASFASFFIYLNRRARQVAAMSADDGAGRRVESDFGQSDAQEGTAQC